MLLAQSLGLKVYHVDIEAQHNTAVSLETASILGGIPTIPQLVGAVVIESALGATSTGIPHKVIGIAAEIDATTGVISITAKYSASITRMIRVALLMKE
jgi:hypothetical protein